MIKKNRSLIHLKDKYMNKIKNNNDKLGLILGIILLIIYIFLATKKEGFHVDEFFSYLNANISSEELNELKESGTNTYTGKQLLEYCMVRDKSEAFDYKEVWKNQTEDTHPPLFYAIIHTVSSILLTHCDLIYIGVAINIVIALLTYIVLCKLIELFLENKKNAVFVAFLYSISMAFVNCMMFVRMYMLLVFFSIALTYLLCKSVSEDKYSFKFYLQLAFVVCGGMLTQYYFLIYLCFSCLILATYLIYKKYFKVLICGMIDVGVSLGVAYLVYPEAVYQMVGGDRGEQALQNMSESDFYSRLTGMFGIINEQVFGGLAGLILIFVVLLLIFLLIGSKIKNINVSPEYMILVLPAICSFCVIAKIAAYIVDRYIMALMFAFFIGTFLLVYNLLSNITTDKISKLITLTIMIVCVIKSYEDSIPFAMVGADTYEQQIQQFSPDTKCIYLYDEGREWVVQCNLFQVENLNEITFYNHTDFLYYCTDFSQYDELIIYNSMEIDDESVNEIVQTACEIGNYNECKYLFSSGYSDTYVLTR